MEIKQIVSELKGKFDQLGGLERVFFVALGGSQAAIYPGKYLLTCESKTLDCQIFSSNEFNYTAPKIVNEKSLVILCSLKATRETVEAVKTAQKLGAQTIAMTGAPDTGMAEVGDYVVVYSNGDNQVYSHSNQSEVLRICFELLHQFEGYENYDKAMEAFEKIDEIVLKAKEDHLSKAEFFANKYKDESVIYVLASGPLYGTGYSMANCHLMEMQWKNAVFVHSGEYFHGPFETTSKDLPMVLLKAIGPTRPMDVRVETFLSKFGGNHIIIDAADTGLSNLDEEVAPYFSSVVMIPLERFYVEQMSKIRDHSMNKRRYMWKFDY